MDSKCNNTPMSLANHASWQKQYLEKLTPSPGYFMVNGAIEMFLKRIISCGAFYLRAQLNVLVEILESGCLKNTLETGTGVTMGGAETRIEATRHLFGCDTDKMSVSDYPKYGYLSVDDPYMELVGNDEMSWHYGDAVFVIDKEKMWRRTTLTVGTSLNFGVENYMVPTRVDNVVATCIPGLRNCQPSKGIVDVCNLAHYFFLFDCIAKHRITPDNFWKINSLLGYEAPSFECFELQYHGPLRLGKEVVGLMLYPEDDQQPLESLAARYEASGVKVTMLRQ